MDKTGLSAIELAVAMDASVDIQQHFLSFAALAIEAGETQIGADVLAYLLAQRDTDYAIMEAAQEHWDELATWICPSVLYDAEHFGRTAELEDVLNAIKLVI